MFNLCRKEDHYLWFCFNRAVLCPEAPTQSTCFFFFFFRFWFYFGFSWISGISADIHPNPSANARAHRATYARPIIWYVIQAAILVFVLVLFMQESPNDILFFFSPDECQLGLSWYLHQANSHNTRNHKTVFAVGLTQAVIFIFFLFFFFQRGRLDVKNRVMALCRAAMLFLYTEVFLVLPSWWKCNRCELNYDLSFVQFRLLRSVTNKNLVMICTILSALFLSKQDPTFL